MSIVLDGTTGITTPGLTNTGTETIVNLTTTGNTILGDASTDTLNVGNGGLVKDASGNVGIGIASPNAKLQVGGTTATSQVRVYGGSAGSTYPEVQLYGASSDHNWTIRAQHSLGLSIGKGTLGSYGTELLYLDSSGNLGLGVTPSAWFSLAYKPIQMNNMGAYIAGTSSYYSGGPYLFIGNNGYDDTGTGTFKYTISQAAAQYVQVNNTHQWKIAAAGTAGNAISFTQAMMLDTSGNLLLNTTAPQWTLSGSAITLAGTSGAYTRQTQSVFVGRYSSSAGLPQYTGNWASSSYWGIGPDSGTNDSTIRIGVTAGDANGAYWTGYAAVKGGAYTNASDYRLKKNVETVAGDVLSLIAQARPVSYNMIQKDEDGNDVETRKEIGFIAHELQALFPEFVTGEKDEVNGAGEVQAQGVDYAKFTAILVKAIQEQQALITTLTDRITALEAK